jgi:hypothetical protein
MAHVPLDLTDETALMTVGTLLRGFVGLLGEMCLHVRAALPDPMQQQLAGQFHIDYHRLAQQLAQVLPRLPATLQLLVEGGLLQHDAVCLIEVSGGWCQAVGLLQALLASCPTIVSSWSELAAWCTACAALLKGQALTAALVGQYESQPAEQSALSSLVTALRASSRLIVGAATFAEQQSTSGFGAPLPGATAAAAETALWGLHTALCRSTHQQTAMQMAMQTAMQTAMLLPGVIADDMFNQFNIVNWDRNLDPTNQTLLAAWRLHCCAQRDVSQPFGR